MLRPIRLSESAESDMDEIWDWTAEQYGVEHAVQYQRVLDQALDDIRLDPERPSSQPHPELGSHVRSYQAALSTSRSGTSIKSPRHIVLYTLESEDEIFVLRILHDRMERRKSLPKA